MLEGCEGETCCEFSPWRSFACLHHSEDTPNFDRVLVYTFATLRGEYRLIFATYPYKVRMTRMLTQNDRSEFRAHVDLNKKDFGTIEYLLRRGRRQLDTYSEEGIRDVLR